MKPLCAPELRCDNPLLLREELPGAEFTFLQRSESDISLDRNSELQRRAEAYCQRRGRGPGWFPQRSISYSLRTSINADASQEGAAAEHACPKSDRHHNAPAPGRGERTGIGAGSERIPNVSSGYGGGAKPCRADNDPCRARPVTG